MTIRAIQNIGFWLTHLANFKTIKRRGLRLLFSRHELPLLVRKSLYRGTYEKEEADLVNQFIRPNDRVLEIGAATGFVSLLVAKIVGEKNIKLYEPNPRMGTIIHRNFELNQMKPNFEQKAVTWDGKDIELHIDEKIVGSSVHKRNQKSKSISVSSDSLDVAVQSISATTLIIDVEGAEFDLLQGEMEGIEKIIIEMHPHIIGEEKISELQKRIVQFGFSLIKGAGIVEFYQRTSSAK